MVEVLDQLLEADQRFAVPGIGRWVVDGDQRGVSVLFHRDFVGQVEDPGLVGFNGSGHVHLLTAGGRACRPVPVNDAPR
ncbi:hypothetical protein D3C84_1108200 [compost metagenome]